MQCPVVALAADSRGKVDIMKRFGWSLLVCSVALATALSATAYGFEAKPVETDGAKSAPAEKVAPGFGLQDQSAPGGAKKSKSGFELPGIGNLGVLPKLDFGLELLYGEAPPTARREEFEGRNTDPEDLTIRGTFKHRF
jgi:hypothetical protein